MEVAVVENHIHLLVSSLDFIQNGSFRWPFDRSHHLVIETIQINSQCDIEVYGTAEFAQVVPSESVNDITE